MFQYTKEHLEQLSAEITTREIKQQPELWQEAFDYFTTHKERIQTFFNQLPNTHIRVIFTGAGTSQYVGDTVLPHIKRYGDDKHFDFQSVGTTNIVSNPHDYFKKDVTTILVSFARSGNSPESVATVQLGQQIVEDFYQITITCAPDGKLAQYAQGDDKNLLLMMPERSNDAGFAMTGSFTCMALTALLIFDHASDADKEKYVKAICDMGQSVIEREQDIQELVNTHFNRVIYLGSGALAGLAREVQLKILELTAGRIATAFDSSLGFRHGPKSFVNEDSLAFVFVSNDDYTRQYDFDILRELQGDKIARLVGSINVGKEENFDGVQFTFDEAYRFIPDGYLALPYAMFGQTLSLLTSVKVGNKPDTPSPTGTVNRVVKGVIIHPLEK
ncbi:SIS domain-containing protein [Granulicatella sp. zg-ZJ]|uniref:SIS domain-containing protein n=1 Tax=unclassified Granulicatella TaxID=2630493 RepID=UPI0013C253BA|nr:MULTISPECIES: SIS domain-containing protein [unclassified Granulicatella]NEW61925.1 SIS domain-containing protein [Granulicatella sp. zg-ZJ]NEW66890.1 SIS domain-containing protein [Granulicatella sp. zg-84]QMI85901.1 SIS domain-containing protein [Carnobacteriaceae bacterium zg-84]